MLLIIYTKHIFVTKFDMCGIVCAYNDKIEIEELRTLLLSMSKQIRHRGPDWRVFM